MHFFLGPLRVHVLTEGHDSPDVALGTLDSGELSLPYKLLTLSLPHTHEKFLYSSAWIK